MRQSRSLLGLVAVAVVLGLVSFTQASVIVAPTDPVYAVAATAGSHFSDFRPTAVNYPAGESPEKAIDGIVLTGTTNGNKYLNFAKLNIGFVVIPSIGPSKLTSFQIATANDAPERDPVTITIEGSNGPLGNLGVFDTNWTLLYSGTTGVDTDPGRNTWGPSLSVPANGFFSYYRVLFPTVRNASVANSMQVSEVALNGVVPEPACLSLLAFAGLLIRRRH